MAQKIEWVNVVDAEAKVAELQAKVDELEKAAAAKAPATPSRSK